MEGETLIIEPGYDASLQTVKLAAEAAADASRVTWLVDGKIVERSEWPYTSSWKLTPGRHLITARAQGHKSDSVSIRVR
jgi:membrane carboxypeptidase/penicillin-binding protein PbpC